MRTQRITFVALVFVFVLVGCAGMTVHRVSDDTKDKGIRYYGSSPYLLIHTDHNGGLVSQLIYLPDPSKMMSAKPYNFAATNNTTLTFDKGVLKTSEVDVDSAAIPKAVITAVTDIAVAAVKAGAALGEDEKPQPTGPSVPLPVLFKIEVDSDGVHLYGPPNLTPEGGIFIGSDTKADPQPATDTTGTGTTTTTTTGGPNA